MNRKQWFVFGIGLVLLGFYFNFVSGVMDCGKIREVYSNTIEENPDEGGDIKALVSVANAWAVSCHYKNIDLEAISAISFALGVVFIISGFLEPKKIV